MKWVIGILFLQVSLGIAQDIRCIDRLLPISRPSAAHQLGSSDWNGNSHPLNPEDAKLALKTLVYDRLYCAREEIEIYDSMRCQQLDENLSSSMTCYSNSTLGQFVLTKDSAQNVNIIFHRGRRL